MIKISNLSKSFSGQTVLDHLNLDIQKGEVVALIGSSGAGKSTFLRSLNYLETPDSGSIQIDDFKVDFSQITQEEILTLRRKLSMVFQQFNLFERRTALENVKEGLVVVKKLSDEEATEIAKEELAKVGLSDREQHYPRHLSGGQKQRVAIARALAMKPDVLLLDEPTSALDNVKEGLVVVKKLSDEEATKIAKEELAKVGLSDREQHYPRHLSGGQKQRVAIARALAMKPDVLLLDEPTSALDPELVGEVEKSIADAARSGQTMILVSHDMSFVAQVADKVLFLDKGKIIESGTPDEIINHPKEERTKEFFASYKRSYI